MKIDAKTIQELRERTGVSIMKCKEALVEAEGDMEKAIECLRKKGEASAAKKLSRETGEGLIFSYLHTNGKVASMVKLYCETDFVSRNDEFQKLGKDLAMHIAASDPTFLSVDDVSEKELAEERKREEEALKESDKPEEVKTKILEGKLQKFREENSLMSQPFVKNPEITVKELLEESISKLGENIKVGEFVRYEI